MKEVTEYFLLDYRKPVGPFSFSEIVEKLQKGQLNPFHFIWTSGFKHWQRIAQVRDFCEDRIFETYKVDPDRFARRGTPRLKTDIPVFVHNEKSLWLGKLVSLSAGGAGIKVANPHLLPKDVLLLHIRPGEVFKHSTNCEIRIISKKFRADVHKSNTILSYNTAFTNLSRYQQTKIKNIVEERTA